MSSIAIPLRADPATAAASRRLFALTLFSSALLLFGLQPIFAKMVLPLLGGAAAVWSIATVFFQALLLAGYLYAHALGRLPIRAGAALHLGLMALAFVTLPVAVANGWGAPPADGQAWWLIGLFAASVGLPFFAVAANGPLLQAWFARSGRPGTHDPYRLYAASNLGSFAALVSYPLAIEPWFPLAHQGLGWTAGFVGLAALIAACAVAAGPGRAKTPDASIASADPIAWERRLSWAALAFVPSGLLVGVTAHISTDVAAVPLLWVAPLALFLLTFVVTFRERTLPRPRLWIQAQVWGTGLALLSLMLNWPLPIALAIHLGLFTVSALLCHAALYRLRPPPERLTDFYLWMSVGGVAGGAFCGLLAPYLFSSVLEYPLLLVAALFCRPGFFSGPARDWAKTAGEVGVPLAVAAAFALAATYALATVGLTFVGTVLVVAWLMLAWRRPPHVAVLAGAALLAVAAVRTEGRETLRSFYGVHKLATSDGGRFLTLSHGTTVHGAMRLREDDGAPAVGRPEPTTYYTREGAIGEGIAAVRAARGGALPSLAVIGLGAGSLACHKNPGERLSFFEIDPLVARIAADRFRFLRECAPEAPIVLGDARLTLAGDRGGHSLLVVDAFASDAIPNHLVTREALGLYLAKLAPGGAILLHISNRHLDLSRILARTAAEHGLVAFVKVERWVEPLDRRYRAPSSVAMLARDPGDLGPVATDPSWTRVVPDPRRSPWTDDHSNILEAMLDSWR
jgi:hypothetical protein